MLSQLPPVEDPRLLINPGAMEDAHVYMLDDGTLLVQTVDFFTPVVDEPYDFGWISAVGAGAGAATDVSGFGLPGHLYEMITGTGLSINIDIDRIPLLDGAFDAASQGAIAEGLKANARYAADFVEYDKALDEVSRILLSEPQTSGGLLIAINPDKIEKLIDSLEFEPSRSVIGGFVKDSRGKITLKRNLSGLDYE